MPFPPFDSTLMLIKNCSMISRSISSQVLILNAFHPNTLKIYSLRTVHVLYCQGLGFQMMVNCFFFFTSSRISGCRIPLKFSVLWLTIGFVRRISGSLSRYQISFASSLVSERSSKFQKIFKIPDQGSFFHRFCLNVRHFMFRQCPTVLYHPQF